MRHPLSRRAALLLRAVVLVAGIPGFAWAPALDRDAERWVKRTLEKMTLDERVGQMLAPGFESIYLPTDSDLFDELARYVRDQHVGGFVAFGGSQPTPGVLLNPGYPAATRGQPMAAASTLNRLQELSPVPLLNSADFETGVGMRLAGATVFPRPMAFGAVGDARLAAEAARITALEGRAIGVHVSFAPVADVNSNPRNPVINTRAFGGTPAEVSVMIASYVRGLQQHGMIATLKHFPGHGDTDVDSHLGLPVISHTPARLDEIELPPFRAGIDAGAGAVMTSHVALPALDPTPDTPVTFSAPIVMRLLRRDLGFGGLIVTDSMEMHGVTRLLSPGEAAVRAVQAGHDILIDLPDTPAAFAAIKAAVQSGGIPEARIGESAERILRTKASLGLHTRKQVALDEVPKLVGGRAHRAVAQVVSERSITLLKDERHAVPLRLPADASVLYLSVLDYPAGWGVGAPSRTLAPELRKRWPRLTAVELSDRSTAAELDLVRATADRYHAIVAAVFVRTASYSGRMDLAPGLARLLNELARGARAADIPFVGILFGNPYVATFLPELPAVLLTYDYYDLAEGSAARALVGEAPIGGRLPIVLPGLFPIGHGLLREVRRPGL